ncbi:MAG TPA: hypothetical protein QF353_04405 [Gammaproteobacteria bacterium]|nr:hypothetical protein [Gammaproteobacteria bacterium]
MTKEERIARREAKIREKLNNRIKFINEAYEHHFQYNSIPEDRVYDAFELINLNDGITFDSKKYGQYKMSMDEAISMYKKIFTKQRDIARRILRLRDNKSISENKKMMMYSTLPEKKSLDTVSSAIKKYKKEFRPLDRSAKYSDDIKGKSPNQKMQELLNSVDSCIRFITYVSQVAQPNQNKLSEERGSLSNELSPSRIDTDSTVSRSNTPTPIGLKRSLEGADSHRRKRRSP